MYIDFERLLKVCRLSLRNDEKEKMEKEINEIIKYFDVLDSIEIKEAKEHQTSNVEVLRKDEVRPFDDIDGLLKNTKTYRFSVVGPKV